jgi:hypothetical protein
VTNESTVAVDDFRVWVSTLPSVVERPYGLGTSGVRSFGVDCEPHGRHRRWVLTGLGSPPRMEGAASARMQAVFRTKRGNRLLELVADGVETIGP